MARPQETVLVFWKGHYPLFLKSLVLLFFRLHHFFSFVSFLKRGYQGLLGEIGGDWGRPGVTRGDRGRPRETGVTGGDWG